MVTFTAWRDEVILRLCWEPGTHITHQNSIDADLKLSALSASQPMALLMDITEVHSVAADARAAMNATTTYTRVALVSTNPFAEITFAFSHQAATPVRYFTSEATALQWLNRTP